MVGRRKPGNAILYTKDLAKVSLAEFLRYYEQPISEEQAWAICYQSCCKMKQILAQELDSVLRTIILDVDNLYIHSDGSVSFTLQHDFDENNDNSLEPADALEDKLTELLGKLIYKALDWGIESHMERELSESLEKLIRFMIKLNSETTKTAIAFEDIIKICEDHFLKPSEAASHYTVICKLLFAEYSELQKLMFTIQSCKEAGLWQGVLGDLQEGVKLHKVMEQLPRKRLPEEGTHVSYSAVVDDIKNKHYTLHKASARKLKERLCQEPSLHERLMMEVKNPPKLRPVITERSSDNCKENFQMFVLSSPCGIIFSDFSNAKKPRLSCITPGPELKKIEEATWESTFLDTNLTNRELVTEGVGTFGGSDDTHLGDVIQRPLPTCNQKTSTKLSLPTIADLMATRYSEIKDSCQRDKCISSRAQICLICYNQYFIWPYMCHLCSSVICKDCCIKMSMPVQPCIRLPLNFFEVIRFPKEEDLVPKDQKTAQLLYEIEHWDSSRVPLVFEPYCALPPLASRTKSMMGWPSVDICTKCEQYLLKILSQKPPCRKRSLSQTALE